MVKISVVITALNEEEKIEKCLRSVVWSDEVVFVDDGSTDNTIEIAKKYKAKVHKHKSRGYVEPSRNFAIAKATNDWILLLDADEQIPKTLAAELREIALNDACDYVFIPRKNIIFGKWIKSEMWWPDYNVRFFKKGSVIWSDKIHSKPELKGREKRLNSDENLAIHHDNYETVNQYLQKLNKYTSVEADQMLSGGYNFKWTDSIVFPVDDFVKTFFLQKGFKDGLHGLVLSLLQAFYMEIVFVKIWENHGFEEVDIDDFRGKVNREFVNSASKIKYWFMESLINESANPIKKIILRAGKRIAASKISKGD